MSYKKKKSIRDLNRAMSDKNPSLFDGLKIYKYDPSADNSKYPNFYYDISDKNEIQRISDINTKRGYDLQRGGNASPMYSSDLFDTDYYISGVVLAHFTFPVINMGYPEDSTKNLSQPLRGRTSKESDSIQSVENTSDSFDQIGVLFDDVSQMGSAVYPSDKPDLPNFVWEGVDYGEYTGQNFTPRPPTLNRGSHDLIFIGELDKNGEPELLGSIAVLNTQFYGNSYKDQSVPPNVDSGYIPSRYHIKVGDIIEIYSGIMVKQSFLKEWVPKFNDDNLINRDEVEAWIKVWTDDLNTKTYFSMTDPMMYRVIPNNTYSNMDSNISWERNRLKGKLKIDQFLPKPRRVSIPLLGGTGLSHRSSLVKISGVKLNVSKDVSNSKSIFLEPGRLYEVIDNSGNTIPFRVCHGTEIAKVMPSFPIDKKFDLVGIVAGPNRNGYLEIWPRTMYDIGLGQKNSTDTSSNLIDIVNSL